MRIANSHKQSKQTPLKPGSLDNQRGSHDRRTAVLSNTLAQEAGEEVEDDLSKAEASKKIEELQEKTGRGIDH